MMKWVFSTLIFFSVVCGLGLGRMNAVSQAALQDCGLAVDLTLGLAGSLCMWSGLMKISDRSGLTDRLCRLCSPLTGLLFPGLARSGAAAKAVSMSITANLLGLGNAATPLGLKAMKELAKVNPLKEQASNHMVTFVVLNTASLQLLPTTTAMMRAQAGSASPMDILPAVWGASLVSVLAGVLTARFLEDRA